VGFSARDAENPEHPLPLIDRPIPGPFGVGHIPSPPVIENAARGVVRRLKLTSATLGGGAGMANVNVLLSLMEPCRRDVTAAAALGTPSAPCVPARRTLQSAVPLRDTCSENLGGRGARPAMKHAASRDLYAYWEERRGTRPAPERADIEPGAIRGVLSDAFILGLDNAGDYPIRLAGTRVCALFGREIKAESFLDLWTPTCRRVVADLMAILADEYVGTVAGVTAQSAAGETIDLELLFLPLGTRRPSTARAIGVLAPLTIPSWLGATPIGPLTLGNRRHIGPASERRLLPRFMAPRAWRGLRVYQGGQA
jgi:hypothetical protein